MADVNVSVAGGSAAQHSSSLLVVQHFERDASAAGVAAQIDARMGGAITRVLESGDFRGRKDETLLLYPREGEIAAERVLLVGAGKREEFTLDRLRRAVGTAIRQAEKIGVSDVTL